MVYFCLSNPFNVDANTGQITALVYFHPAELFCPSGKRQNLHLSMEHTSRLLDVEPPFCQYDIPLLKLFQQTTALREAHVRNTASPCFWDERDHTLRCYTYSKFYSVMVFIAATTLKQPMQSKNKVKLHFTWRTALQLRRKLMTWSMQKLPQPLQASIE